MKKGFVLFAAIALVMMSCEKEPDYTLSVVDFEDAISTYLASSEYGDNLYNEVYPDYIDVESDLKIGLASSGAWSFNGTFLSQRNNIDTAGYLNQCSAFYKDASTGFGGNNGSKTFAVSYGYNSEDYLYGSDSRTFLGFNTGTTEKVFDHFYVNNTTYAALSMRDGDASSPALTTANADWFKLVITGIDAEGAETGEIEFYLADFRTASSAGIVTEWTKVDLSSLGEVNKLRFDLQSSSTGDYGMNVPGYFCFDDVTIRDL